MLIILYILTLVSSYYFPPTDLSNGDDEIIRKSIQELHDIDSASDLNECLTCKTRLQVGKFLSLTRPDLVPQIFVTWCIESGYDQTQCEMNYGYGSNDVSSTGNDFTKVVGLMNPSGLDGDYFCYYHDSNCHILPETPEIDMNKMWPKKPKNYLPPDNSGENFHVLHISDINLQLDYEIFSESNCSQSLCCSKNSKNLIAKPPVINENMFDGYYDSSYKKNHFEKGKYLDLTKKIQTPVWSPAKQFGEYSCDTPTLLLNSTMQCIRDLHQNHLSFEFAIFTGGTVDNSDRSYMNKNKNIKSQEISYKILKHYLDDVDVIPTFGTKDIFPINQLPQRNLTGGSNDYQWQFDLVADLWSELGWIDHQTAKQIRYSRTGFTIETKLGLKIISLNSNVWNSKNLYNFWNVLNVDSFGIWKFLINELIDSERNHQRCWIIAHLPPNHQSLSLPTKVFLKIIERFSPKVIAAIFFGYIHDDSFIIQYGSDGKDLKNLKNAINHALIGPSISPYNGYNPAWRYYSVDKQSFSITNSFTYYTKLIDCSYNDGAEPNWDFGYSARDVYDPEQSWPSDLGLTTEFWHHVGERINNNPELNLLYQRLENRWSPFSSINNDSYCKITSFSIDSRKQCMITEDQDDYVEPIIPNDYISLIHVKDKSVEYIEKQEEKSKDCGDDDNGEEIKKTSIDETPPPIDDEISRNHLDWDLKNIQDSNNDSSSSIVVPLPKKQKGKSINLNRKINFVKFD
ncbi:uncharacterized protein KGF55_002023 [Candida pseudojiufengensis]|uniref:uncharacterized protein n=1 Tax=Candida pseudojiufengensis TaxID=497109 RepID=UPI002224171A|nr:uncharacterized protein KGF55_002023 [Candida pseudojiufengensis]KAI5964081.1 hypothetical protein KGF55_002023 [Candida pseudojiufengensis]